MSSGLNLKCGLPYYLVRGEKLSRAQVFPAALDMWGAAGPLLGDVPGASLRELGLSRALCTFMVRVLCGKSWAVTVRSLF